MVTPQRLDADHFRRQRFSFFTASPTRWGDCDRFGHVNNVQFVRYFESGRLDYFHRVLDLDTVPDAVDSLIIADIHVNFLRQINHPCELEVGTRVSRLGNSSFDFEASIFVQGEDELYSTATATCVWFNFRDNHSTPIPPDARETITKFEGLTT